jgi:hypothetical protein
MERWVVAMVGLGGGKWRLAAWQRVHGVHTVTGTSLGGHVEEYFVRFKVVRKNLVPLSLLLAGT